MRRRRRFTEAERAEIWDRLEAGQTAASVAAVFGRYPSAIRALQSATGGLRPAPRRRRASALDLVEREEISRGLSAGMSLRAIASATWPFRTTEGRGSSGKLTEATEAPDSELVRTEDRLIVDSLIGGLAS
jgi:transposase-like protein